jgi:hypothetical protein
MTSLKASEIDQVTFKSTLARYDEQISLPLKELEKFRMEELPSILKERGNTNDQETWMEKKELVKLVEWKLYDYLIFLL